MITNKTCSHTPDWHLASWNHAHHFWNIVCNHIRIPWLPVLSHIPPRNLRRQEATAKLLTTVQLNDKLPLCSDINSHPSVRLLSRHPVWLNKPAPDATSAWVDWCMVQCNCCQPVTRHWPNHLSWFQPVSASVVHIEQISNWSGSMYSKSCVGGTRPQTRLA